MQPRIEDSAKRSRDNLEGNLKTAVLGTTQYSAKPPIEYIATSSPSFVFNLVDPSKSCPFPRFNAKKGSQVSSSPNLQKRHFPQGMMKGHTTGHPMSEAS